jgi:hypothetical protein
LDLLKARLQITSCFALSSVCAFPVPEPPLLFSKLVQHNVWVFPNQHERLLAAARTEAEVTDAFLVVLRFAID